jgi:hypothetical protein
MKYMDGNEVLLGDMVGLGNDMSGVVVAVIDVGAYSPGYSQDEWSYLQQGALLEAEGFGLLHCPTSEHDFALINRAR